MKKGKHYAISGSITAILMIIVAFLTSFVDGISVHPLVTLSIIIIIAMFYFMTFFIVAKQYNSKIERMVETIKKEILEYYDTACADETLTCTIGDRCSIHNKICCVATFLDSEFQTRMKESVSLNEEECAYYNLLRDDMFDEKEKRFFQTHPNGEIWIVSNALETEIKTDEEFYYHPDESLERSMGIVEQNIKNGGRYTQFVALGAQGANDVTFENRCRIYWSPLDPATKEEKQKRLPIIRIDDDFAHLQRQRSRVSDPDLEYMVKLTSSVLFVDNDYNGRLFVEGYFCLRPDDDRAAKPFERRTIFYKMPKCMQDDYYFFLKKKQDEYYKKIKSNIQ